MINDVIDIKVRNIKDIINAVRFRDGLTKKDIARTTDLSFSTVSSLSNQLKEMNIFLDEKLDLISIGRPPLSISLNYSAYCSICLDLQLEDTLRYAILDLRNNILCDNTIDISDLNSTAQIAQLAKQLIDKCLTEHCLDDKNIFGVGVSVPAVFDKFTEKLVNSSVRVFENSPLKNDFQQAFRLPVYVDNIANFYALSVHTKYPDISNIVCMDISQGVGVGVVSEGQLVRGKNGYGTEVAHIPIGDPQRQCQFCGGYGCVETDLSMSGILKKYDKQHTAEPLFLRWKNFMEYLKEDDELAGRIAQDIGGLAGRLATILVNLFDPDLFYIGGYISDLPVSIERYLIDELNLRCDRSIERGLVPKFDKNDSERILIGISNTIYDGWNPTAKYIPA